VSVLPNDYDSDPGRFLSADQPSRDDVHPHVADRFAAAGARTVLDVGGGNGRLARLLPARGLRCLLIDASPAMLALAPRPSARADGGRLPAADGSVDAVALLYTLYHYADPLVPISEARRVLKPGGLLAACAANRDTHPELAHVIPDWGAASTFDGEDAAAIVTDVVNAPGDTVEEDRWDGTPIPLASLADATARPSLLLPSVPTTHRCVSFYSHLCAIKSTAKPRRACPGAATPTSLPEASCPCTRSSTAAVATYWPIAARTRGRSLTQAAGWRD